jgi:glycosyltransferase involved in cell wall biosynthesis
LTTKGTPWSILPERGCGWWVDATVDGIAQGLRQATDLDAETLQAMGAKGRALVIAEFNWKRVAEHMLSTYASISAKPLA